MRGYIVKKKISPTDLGSIGSFVVIALRTGSSYFSVNFFCCAPINIAAGGQQWTGDLVSMPLWDQPLADCL